MNKNYNFVYTVPPLFDSIKQVVSHLNLGANLDSTMTKKLIIEKLYNSWSLILLTLWG